MLVEVSAAEQTLLATGASYRGSPQHKRNPGDFGLEPPSAPRPDKTLCDEAGIFESRVFEGMLGGNQPGQYHGYPIRRTDPLFEQVLGAWRQRT